MTPAHLALAAAALIVCVRAAALLFLVPWLVCGAENVCGEFPSPTPWEPPLSYTYNSTDFTKKAVTTTEIYNVRQSRVYGDVKLPPDCLYESRWHSDGAPVQTRDACLRCVCSHGALACRRRTCTSLPDPLPPRCHVRHRRGVCCPELHCPGGVTLTDDGDGVTGRFEDVTDSEFEVTKTTTPSNVCVEGGTVFAAGSAMGSRVACEQCFCLQGARRCVRPKCLPPPPHCAPRPARGACCPQRYYCEKAVENPPHEKDIYDCEVNGTWVSEGSSVSTSASCSTCFCLRGEVHCQALSCAPRLGNCRPLLAPGDCCAHQYVCDNRQPGILVSRVIPVPDNSLASTRYDDRAFHSSKSSKVESITMKILTKIRSTSSATKNLITTTKVKRKTDEPPLSSSQKQENNTSNITSTNIPTTQKPFSPAKLMEMFEETKSTEAVTERTTEQPEGTVKIVINGTINCTAELSSTSLPLSVLNDTDKIQMETMPRVPIVNIEAQTYSPNDIITDRNVNGGFDENDTFTINVTSSLMTNTSRTTSRPVMSVSKIPVPTNMVDAVNSSKKTKGDYDYDYTEPTLPPSLPNLKIIPFVAADAVVDDEPVKDTLTYPILEREDKFPVYYPSADSKNLAFPRREDTYPKQYPVFVSEKSESSYSGIGIPENVDLTSDRYPTQNELGVHDYTVSTLLGGMPEVSAVTKVPTTSSTFKLETPAVNLFSPPIETEGGFIPKGPGIMEYYTGFPSTPPGPTVPHLTTSMQLDITKGECTSDNGSVVAQGASIRVGCLECTCAWATLRCTPRLCLAVPGCVRRAPHARSHEPCCGDLVCVHDNINKTTPSPMEKEANVNETKVDLKNETFVVSQSIDSITNIDNPNTNEMTTEEGINDSTYTNDITKAPETNIDSVQNTTAADATTTPKLTTKLTTTTTPASSVAINDTSQEYEDDDDDGFSFGSVLKLLLSDSYESTTAATFKKPTTKPPQPTLPPTPTSTRRPPLATVAPFIPLPSYIPPKKSSNTINRIDHLVLGEATAIKRTTPRPITNKTTKRPIQKTTTENVPFVSVTHEGPRPPNLGGIPGVGPGLLKLAGCNIYGRMYRVGRIIAELSTPCQECWCTELGVQCKPLGC